LALRGRGGKGCVRGAIFELGSNVGRDEHLSKKTYLVARFLPRRSRGENKNEKTSRLIAESLDKLAALRINSRLRCNKEIDDAIMSGVLAVLG
jgi:hypothetical protein